MHRCDPHMSDGKNLESQNPVEKKQKILETNHEQPTKTSNKIVEQRLFLVFRSCSWALLED